MSQDEVHLRQKVIDKYQLHPCSLPIWRSYQ